MLTVPVLRPEVAREYEEYQVAVDEYNRKRMEEMRQPVPGAPVCMAYAHAAPRCAHVRADGTRCAAPALRGRTICYAHTRMLMARKPGLKLPVLEDAGGIALAAMQVVQQMLDGELPRRKAATALYGIQIVATTLNHRPFAVQPTSVVMEAEGLPPEEELLEAEGKRMIGSSDDHPNRPKSGRLGTPGDRIIGSPPQPAKTARSGGPGSPPQPAKTARSGGPGSPPQPAKTARSGGPGSPPQPAKTARSGGPGPSGDQIIQDAAPDGGGSDEAVTEQPQKIEPMLGREETSLEVPLDDRDPSLRSGLENQLGKEWWDEWEKKVRAIASGSQSGKGPQGVKDGDVHEGVG